MIATLQARAAEREQIDKQVAEFLARGGQVKQAERTAHAIPWPGTDDMAVKHLRTAGYCAARMHMTAPKFEIMAMEPSFPQAYMFRGERQWNYMHAKTWWHSHKKGQV